ncbi:cyclic pyranopterin monophosphate synthase MoaC [Govanella unica]|uniref:Cyclic pyranopterin monophosphate synthase n=1 Tax=Govanella unica TaxID=2975056 RepID=A0A9X3Z779_9PROT|nr:cyclic pyranopterin monophosphate synthase MoaC [Govania unica]MDA5193788.1 cyclic pyranopterin monophosphate synthase MoaC [Govania unica]
MTQKLTHLDAAGHAHMVDVGEKDVTSRTATARGFIRMSAKALTLVTEGTAPKGDVLAAARIAGIMAAKKTSDLIPLCHPLAITKVSVDLAPAPGGIEITATVKVAGKTGVEMEALTAVTVAALTVYDMVKAADKSMRIEEVRLVYKDGGRSGRYEAD